MPLYTGEAAPWFRAQTASEPEFNFDGAAGRYVLMLFLPVEAEARALPLRVLSENQHLFDDAKACCFVVVRDPETASGLRDLRGLRWFIDLDQGVSRQFGAPDEGLWILLDPTLRSLGTGSIALSENVLKTVARLPPPAEHAAVPLHAPVMIAPRIFEPELCRALIELHEARGGTFTGVMRDVDGQTVAVMDEAKKRRDVLVEDPELKRAIRERLERRLFPVISLSLGFRVSEIERYLVACYDAGDGGVFHPHRDNNTKGTAARQFACSINLNGDFEGGDLRFGEYGMATYRPPVGGAAVFSCSVLHEALRVTRGRRYAFLPFLYDEAGWAAASVRPETALEPAR